MWKPPQVICMECFGYTQFLEATFTLKPHLTRLPCTCLTCSQSLMSHDQSLCHMTTLTVISNTQSHGSPHSHHGNHYRHCHMLTAPPCHIQLSVTWKPSQSLPHGTLTITMVILTCHTATTPTCVTVSSNSVPDMSWGVKELTKVLWKEWFGRPFLLLPCCEEGGGFCI